ncbi:MAG: xanthine dehydrogenase family protein molybdopterin-binding subunit [Azospirillaceae bacterium]
MSAPGADRPTRLVAGRGRYTADEPIGDAAHVVFVRADLAHARIEAIETAEAAAMPGVIAVLTAGDLGPLKGLPALIRDPAARPEDLFVPERLPLARDRIRHVGEAVAMVVAATRSQAEDAAEAVLVEATPLPVVAAIPQDEASGPPPTVLHDGAPDNVASRLTLGDRAAVDRALASADRVVDLTVALPRVAPSPMEPRAVIARFEPETGRYHLTTPHQGLHEVRMPLAAALGVEPERIRVHPRDTGGAFGARGAAYPEHVALLAAARALGRPLAWRASRLETFQSDVQGRGNILTGRLGLDREGRFTALDVRYRADLGAFVSTVGAHINVRNPSRTLTGCYAIPAAAIEVVQHFTNAVPTGPYRGAGRPDIAYLVERLVDRAAAETGIDRADLRRRNVVQRDAFPYTTPIGAVYDSGDYAGLLDRALAAADRDGFEARRAAAAARGRLRGLGIGLFVEMAGGGAAPKDQAAVSLGLAADGLLEAEVVIGGNCTGQAQERTYAAVLRRAFDAGDGLAIAVRANDGERALIGSGSFASRSIAGIGAAVADAGRAADAAVRALAAQQFGREADGLRLVDGRILAGEAVLGDLRQVVATGVQGSGRIEVVGEAPLVETFPSGCHVAEVEIDPETGVVTVVGYVAVDDAGAVIDHASVDGQLRGAIAQGLGEALMEAVRFDPVDGQLLTASFMDYALPRADEIPPIALDAHDTPSPTNPLGAKGVGEAGVTGALACIPNAVIDALRPAGVTHLDIPLTPETVWRAIGAAGES